MKTWMRIPTWWIRGNNNAKLLCFTTNELGPSIAALILYVTFALRVAETDTVTVPAGTVDLTFTEIENLTGLSRHLLSKGIRKLEREGLISVTKVGRKNVYCIIGYKIDEIMPWGGRPSWGKVPRKYLYDTQGRLIFSRFSLRYPAELFALKLYLAIIAFQQSDKYFALISYPNLQDHTGIPVGKIRSGLSHLINLSLIHIDRDPSVGGAKLNPPNQYRVCGVDPYRHLATMERDLVVLQELAEGVPP